MYEWSTYKASSSSGSRHGSKHLERERPQDLITRISSHDITAHFIWETYLCLLTRTQARKHLGDALALCIPHRAQPIPRERCAAQKDEPCCRDRRMGEWLGTYLPLLRLGCYRRYTLLRLLLRHRHRTRTDGHSPPLARACNSINQYPGQGKVKERIHTYPQTHPQRPHSRPAVHHVADPPPSPLLPSPTASPLHQTCSQTCGKSYPMLHAGTARRIPRLRIHRGTHRRRLLLLLLLLLKWIPRRWGSRMNVGGNRRDRRIPCDAWDLTVRSMRRRPFFQFTRRGGKEISRWRWGRRGRERERNGPLGISRSLLVSVPGSRSPGVDPGVFSRLWSIGYQPRCFDDV